MPFANTGFAAPNNFTNSAGVYDYTAGTATTTLSGRYIRMVDSCGAISASSATGAIALGGVNGQHDCTTPGSGGAGNTAASRSGFFELNKLVEQARGWLPANAWLQAQMTANMNLNSTCNAFWNGSTVNFYRSGGGCRNTGELAAVFDHEWGHGMDDNDAAGVAVQLQRGVRRHRRHLPPAGLLRGPRLLLDPERRLRPDRGRHRLQRQREPDRAHCATDCSGVRDSDWARHADNTPDTALGYVCTHCITGPGPCGRQVHCAAAPVRQAAWDLVTRDLTAAPFGFDSQTAFIVGNKLFYQGSGNIGALARLHLRRVRQRLRRHQRLHAVDHRRRRQRQPERRHAAHERDLRRVQPPRDRVHDPRRAEQRLRRRAERRDDACPPPRATSR